MNFRRQLVPSLERHGGMTSNMEINDHWIKFLSSNGYRVEPGKIDEGIWTGRPVVRNLEMIGEIGAEPPW
jgi:hypothetical protein